MNDLNVCSLYFKGLGYCISIPNAFRTMYNGFREMYNGF